MSDHATTEAEGSRRGGRQLVAGGLAVLCALAPVAGMLLSGVLGWYALPLMLVITPALVLGLQIVLLTSWPQLPRIGAVLAQVGALFYVGCWLLLTVMGDIEGGIPTERQGVLLMAVQVVAVLFFLSTLAGGVLLLLQRARSR